MSHSFFKSHLVGQKVRLIRAKVLQQIKRLHCKQSSLDSMNGKKSHEIKTEVFLRTTSFVLQWGSSKWRSAFNNISLSLLEKVVSYFCGNFKTQVMLGLLFCYAEIIGYPSFSSPNKINARNFTKNFKYTIP